MSASPRPGLRWAAPVGVTALVLGGAVLGPALSASAEVELPRRSPEQLLTDLQTARVDAFSGTVAQRADLGLPELPRGVGGEYSTDALSLLAGEHTLRVWVDGERARVALHGTVNESDVVTDGTQVWTWSTEDRTVHHLVLPDAGAPAGTTVEGDRDRALGRALPPVTPDQVTAYVLARLDPSTEVSAGPHTLVAGRPAYELVLDPQDGSTLVGSIRIAVDAEEHVPTRVQVLAAGATRPALEVGFTSLSFETPDDDALRFTPPADATVERHTPDTSDGLTGLDGLPGAGHGSGPDGAVAPEDGTTGPDGARRGAVVGSGWDAVVVGRAPGALAEVDGDLATFLATLPRVSGPWGSGRLLTSSLFTALLTDDGRLLVGAVDDATLLAAAGDPAADLG